MKTYLSYTYLVLSLMGCSPDGEPEPVDETTGASSGSGGVSTNGSGGALVAAAGGSPASGGHFASGGVIEGTGAESSGGSGGDGSPGTGGNSTVPGTGGANSNGKAPVVPSMGCGKTNPMTGTAASPLSVSGHQYYVKLPTNYDPAIPSPVIMVFHPTGNPIDWAEKTEAIYEKNSAKDEAIRVFPKSAGSGWEASDVAFFAAFHQQILDSYCVDESRVFAAGESSGGDFVSILGCEHADKLRAVAPCATKDVSQYPLNASSRKCTAQVTAIVIHGKNDNVVGPANGPKTRDFYKALNHCSDATEPVEGFTDKLSNCIRYTECDEGYPLYWCLHEDPNYSGTNHGWPKFAGDMTWRVFSLY